MNKDTFPITILFIFVIIFTSISIIKNIISPISEKDYITGEVLKVRIDDEGEYHITIEKQGRIKNYHDVPANIICNNSNKSYYHILKSDCSFVGYDNYISLDKNFKIEYFDD